MTKAKRLIAVLFASMMIISSLGIATSAATSDHYHTFSWTSNQRYADSPAAYKKANNSATYFKVADSSMPVSGFYIKTTLGSSSSVRNSSSSYFLINSYGGKTIKHSSTKAAGKYAGLRTYYPTSHYNWGNVTLAWSEDYSEDGSARLNW